jgi:hypothetical protein
MIDAHTGVDWNLLCYAAFAGVIASAMFMGILAVIIRVLTISPKQRATGSVKEKGNE